MTSKITAVEPHVEKFQQLLRELFQFDCAELDFGIYRIMNHKRDVIEKFITEKLPKSVAAELDRGPLVQQTQAADALEQARQAVRNGLGDQAFDASGDLEAAYHGTPLGKGYLEAKSRAADGSNTRVAIGTKIYNHLYIFFSRYYQDGDFISKRRHSKRERYAIPYNGEEVYLHWANSDQYYIKTAEHFRDYDWKAANGVTVRFKVQRAYVEQNNVKGDKRFFLPLGSEPSWDEERREIIIPFEYRPLTPQEANKHGNQNQQKGIIAEAVAAIPQQLGGAAQAVTALTQERRRNGNGPVSNLEHHLLQYTRRNTSDFFIHKDLKGFLARELDFYLKNEVLNLDEMERAGEQMAEGWFQMMRLIKSVGNPIIDFLEQIENFQKMLWEKRKFVTETHYCITLRNIGSEFYSAIAANEEQWAEWQELFGIEEKETERRVAMLPDYPTLMLHTKHFERSFVDKLLASFEDLDGKTDGLLIDSENWQALNFLASRYQGQVQCVYIDPPFNSKSTEILYKNTYKHSSWLTLIENRLDATAQLMGNSSVLTIAIDENEQERLGLLLSKVFPAHLKTCVSVVHNPGGIQGDNFSYNNEFAYFVYPPGSRSVGMQKRDDNPDIRPLRDVSTGQHLRGDAANCFYPIYIREEKVIGFGDVCDDDFHPGSANVDAGDGVIAVYPIDAQEYERKWVFSRQNVERIKEELTVEWNKSRLIWDVIRRKTVFNYKTVWDNRRYNANSHGSKLISDIFGAKAFSFPKSLYTVTDSVQLATDYSKGTSNVLDYFAGSGTTGHAVINLNREDGGKRKFILVEMGEYFDTVLLPRIKKVIFTPEWKAGKPQRMTTQEEAERSPGIVKYIRLESYEDALNNIEFDAATEQLALEEKYEDYLLKYMLRWETKGSGTLLNVEKLTSPFSYKLKLHIDGETQVKTVDVPETFNYLLGLNVLTRQVYEDDGRRYLVYRGETREASGHTVAVIWRETEGWERMDLERDRIFVEEHNLAEGTDKVYVNGDSFIPKSEAVERLFRERMFAKIDV